MSVEIPYMEHLGSEWKRCFDCFGMIFPYTSRKKTSLRFFALGVFFWASSHTDSQFWCQWISSGYSGFQSYHPIFVRWSQSEWTSIVTETENRLLDPKNIHKATNLKKGMTWYTHPKNPDPSLEWDWWSKHPIPRIVLLGEPPLS